MSVTDQGKRTLVIEEDTDQRQNIDEFESNISSGRVMKFDQMKELISSKLNNSNSDVKSINVSNNGSFKTNDQ